MKQAGNYRIRAKVSSAAAGQIEVRFDMLDIRLRKRSVERPENHCLMRAFDRLFLEGNPRTGKIGVLVLYNPSQGGLRCLASFAVTDYSQSHGILGGHRFVLFPSWKSRSDLLAFVDSSGKTTPFDAHHVTFQPASDGTLSCHATLSDRREDRYVLSRKLEAEEGVVRLCQVFIPDNRLLDPVGRLTRVIPSRSDVDETIRRWNQCLQTNFPYRQPVMIPPDSMKSGEESVVWGSLYLSKTSQLSGKTIDRFPIALYPKMPPGWNSQPHKRRLVEIGIYPDMYLLVSLRRIDVPIASKTL